MANVVRHFGDVADGEKPCGICDYCAPAKCTAQRFRSATKAEHAALLRVVAELHAGGARSTGRLYSELFPHKEMSRDDFENVLGGMARAGIVRLDDAVFEKNGRQIPYRTARLAPAGSKLDVRTPLELVMKDTEPPPTPRKRKRKVGVAASPPTRQHRVRLHRWGAHPQRVWERKPSGHQTQRRTLPWKRHCERGGWPRPGGWESPPSASLPTAL
jgi:hypothetical protein